MPNQFYYEDMYSKSYMGRSPRRGGSIDDRMEDIYRIRAFSQQARDMSLLDLTSLGVGDSSFLASIAEAPFSALGLVEEGSFSKSLGYGKKSRYTSLRDHQRLIRGETNRRLDKYNQMYNPFEAGIWGAGTQIGRDVSNFLGVGDLYDSTIGAFNLQQRTELDTANKLTRFMARSMTRDDLQGAEVEGLEYQKQLASFMADPSKLQGLASTAEIEDFKKTSGFSDYKILGFKVPFLKSQEESAFTMEEQRQLMMRGLQSQQFVGTEASFTVDPVTGRRVAEGKANTPEEQRSRRENAVQQQALRSQRMMNNIRLVQEEFGITDTEEAFDFTEILAGNKKIADLKRGDIQKIKSLKEQVGLTNEAIKSVLETGEEIAQNLDISSTQGRNIAIQNIKDVRNLRSLGAIGESTTAALGGEGGVQRRFGAGIQQVAASEGGRRFRGARAAVEIIRKNQGSEAADEALKELNEEFAATGRTSRETAAKLFKKAGFTDVDPGRIDTFIKSKQGFFDTKLGDVNVEGEQVQQMLERARKFRPESESAQIDFLMRDPRTKNIFKGFGEEMTGDLLRNKVAVKDALTQRDTRRGISTLAERMSEINEKFSNEQDRKFEIAKVLKEQKLESQFDVDELAEMKDIKSVGRLEEKLEERKGKPKSSVWNLWRAGDAVSDSMKTLIEQHNITKNKFKEVMEEAARESDIKKLPEEEQREIRDYLGSQGKGPDRAFKKFERKMRAEAEKEGASGEVEQETDRKTDSGEKIAGKIDLTNKKLDSLSAAVLKLSTVAGVGATRR